MFRWLNFRFLQNQQPHCTCKLSGEIIYFSWVKQQFRTINLLLLTISYYNPYAPCMEYLPTFALKITQM